MAGGLRRDQRGIVSMIAVLFIAILLTVVVLSMVRLTIAEQRLSTDFLLSTKAGYAAEAGVDDAVFRLQAGTLTDQTCGDLGARDAVEEDLATGQVFTEYTCQLVDMDAAAISNKIERGTALQLDLSDMSSSVSRLRLSWYQGADDGPSFGYTFYPGNNPTSAPTMVPILRAELIRYPNSNIRRTDIQQSISFLRPVASPAGATAHAADNWRTYASAGDAAKVADARCQPASTTGDNEYACSFELTGLTPASQNYVLQASSFYERAPVSFRVELLDSSSTPQPQPNIEATIDVTARAGDVFRRIVYRVPLKNSFRLPSYVVGATDILCKDLVVSNLYNYVTAGGNDGCSLTGNPN
jgi:hypothetical protein